jgi:peptidoglycan hydrolase CwlO-like protein
MDIHVFHHFDLGGSVNAKVDRILALLQDLKVQGEKMTGKIDDVNRLLTELDAATNSVAAEIDALKAQISGGLTAEEATGVVTRLATASDRLKALAADPANPVPTTPTDPPATA